MRAELWEELGKALGMSSEHLEKISMEEEGNLEKCKQCVLNVREKGCLQRSKRTEILVLCI